MGRFVAVLVIAAVVIVGAWTARPDPAYLAGEALQRHVIDALTDLPRASADARIAVVVDSEVDGDRSVEALRADLAQRDDAPNVVAIRAGDPVPPAAHVIHASVRASSVGATVRWHVDGGAEQAAAMSAYALLPPLLAIVAAMLLRRVIPCLALGVAAAGVIAVWPSGANPLWGVWRAASQYVVHASLGEQFNIEIIAFVVLISATVAVAQASGGIAGVLEYVVRVCRSARAARVGAFVAGILLFFDDYLNCIIVGSTMRPLTDRFRVSRAKLAYIVDSTAAPVAGLSLVSTWIAFEVSQTELGLRQTTLPIAPYEMFVATVPYRFYCWFTLAFVLVVCVLGRDFGPMRAAERRAADSPDAPTDSAETADGSDRANRAARGSDSSSRADGAGVPARAVNAVLPIGITLVGMVVGMWWTARHALAANPPAPGVLPFVRAVLANANSMRAFAAASGVGFVIACALVRAQRLLGTRAVAVAVGQSVRRIALPVMILILAWAIGAACRDIGTATYLVSLYREVLNPVVFSTVVFVVSCLVSFSTGTSYGTMALLVPNIVPLACAVGEHSGIGAMALATISVGAVLDGAIFGDHCSPISDTTILSAIASECSLVDHVRTQLPYALTAMVIALAVGYLPAAMGAPPVASLAVGAVVLVLFIRYIGRRASR